MRASRGGFWWKRVQKRSKKENKWASRREMASVMGICGGLVGPKRENVDFSLVFKAFLKVQRSPEDSRTTNN